MGPPPLREHHGHDPRAMNPARGSVVPTRIEVRVGHSDVLPGRPEDEISAGAGWRTGRGQISYEFTYVGRNFTESFETASLALPARYLHDVAYRLRLAHGLQATLEIKNLFDRRTYDVAQFPLPGRSVNGRVAWEF